MKSSSNIYVLTFCLFMALGASGAGPASAQPFAAWNSAVPAVYQDNNSSIVDGAWQVSFTDPQGTPRQGTLHLQQDGLKISGTFQGLHGSIPLTGEFSGNHIALRAKPHGTDISFIGTVEGSKMSGTTGSGKSWIATRR